MQKEIKYNGYTAQPSDYESPDGDLSLSFGMVPENGSLKPVMPPKVLTSWSNVHRVYVHKNNFTHYIVIQHEASGTGYTVSWAKEDTLGTLTPILTLSNETLVDVTAIGNMLIISSSAKMYYVLWKDGAYKLLGNSIPNVDIAFALSGDVVSKTYSNKNITSGPSYSKTPDEAWELSNEVPFTVKWSEGNNVQSDYADISGVTLEANTDYAFSVKYTSSHADTNGYSLELSGLRSDNNTREILFQKYMHDTTDRVKLTPTVKYTELKVRYTSNLHIAPTGSRGNTLVIETGSAATKVALDKVIANTSDNYTAMMSIMNSYVNKEATAKGKFIYPFFVRYGIRLYDGSYMHISAPILMVPNSGYVPFLSFDPKSAAGNLNINAYAFITALQMKVISTIDEKWQDIVEGVDVFLSQPIYPYNQGQAYDDSDNELFSYKILDSSADFNELSSLSQGCLLLNHNADEASKGYVQVNLYYILKQYYDFGGSAQSQWVVTQIAPKTEQEVRENVISTSNYYLVRSYKLSELQNFQSGFADIDIKKDSLQSLVNHIQLKDELLSNRTVVSGNLYAYNNRLHVYNASLRLPEPTSVMRQNSYCSVFDNTYGYSAELYVYLHNQQGTKVVQEHIDNLPFMIAYMISMPWFFYPDNNAYKAVIVFNSTDSSGFSSDSFHIELPLKKHDFLNGTYWMADKLDGLISDGVVEGAASVPTVNDVLQAPSTIYVSEVRNPFTFLAVSTVSVGCNNIIGLATAAKPLSTDKFGMFPLYAFTDNGVWALETSDTGSYTARKPITRDVCISADSICELESSVLFATDRGIMELSGSVADCITDAIKTQFPFSFSGFSNWEALISYYNTSKTKNEKELAKDTIQVLPFDTFLKGCRIINDYSNQRIIFFNKDVRYAYVLSRQSLHWGMVQSDCVLTVNAYPRAQAIDAKGNLLDFGQTDATGITALLVTRPFAMGEPDIHKTITTLIQRGFFRHGHVSTVLYGSVDMFSWYEVTSSVNEYIRNIEGQPYKYFRMVVVGKMEQDESLYGFSIEYQPRLTNQLR